MTNTMEQKTRKSNGENWIPLVGIGVAIKDVENARLYGEKNDAGSWEWCAYQAACILAIPTAPYIINKVGELIQGK